VEKERVLGRADSERKIVHKKGRRIKKMERELTVDEKAMMEFEKGKEIDAPELMRTGRFPGPIAWKSDSIIALAKALTAAQGEIKEVKKNCTNPFYNSKYTDLAGIWAAIRGPLTKRGLSIVQLIRPSTKEAIIETFLLHESGEWLKSVIALIPTKNNAQGMGSAYTYARRYALSALVGVASEEDDDGNATVNPPSSGKPEVETPKAKVEDKPTNPAPSSGKDVAPSEKKKPDRKINVAQATMIFTRAKRYKISQAGVKKVMKKLFNKERTTNLLESEMDKLLQTLEEIWKAHQSG